MKRQRTFEDKTKKIGIMHNAGQMTRYGGGMSSFNINGANNYWMYKTKPFNVQVNQR